jgi:hypothetical protein
MKTGPMGRKFRGGKCGRLDYDPHHGGFLSA